MHTLAKGDFLRKLDRKVIWLGSAGRTCRNRPAGAITLGQREGLPTIEESDIVLLKRAQKPSTVAAIEAVGTAFIFLDLLEGDVQSLTDFGLADA